MNEPQKYTKLFALGHRMTADLFKDVVEVTEKIDGSQFRFVKIDNVLRCFSKNVELDMATTGGMFGPAVQHCKEMYARIPDGVMIFGETLASPRHNVIKYDRVPRNHIALFSAQVMDLGLWYNHQELRILASDLDVDVAPLICHTDEAPTAEFLKKLLEFDSYLGGSKVEGVVFKNYSANAMVGNVLLPFLGAKYVSEKFKEKMNLKPSGKGTWEIFMDQFRTEARWAKARIHLKEQGLLENELRDIPKLVSEVQRDIVEEHESEIKDFLFNLYGRELTRKSVQGMAEWWKQELAKEVLKDGDLEES